LNNLTIQTKIFGQQIIYPPQIGSTNVELKRLAQEGAAEGLLYLTDEQTAGKGRLNRSWQAPPGSSLLMSLLFRPARWVKPHEVQRLTMLCALALAEAVEHCTGITARLKWPNDLLSTEGKKLAGVLTEFELNGEELSWVVVGMGLNVNVDFSQVESHDPLSQTATSLSTLVGHAVEREPILRNFLERVEQRYMALQHGHVPQTEWAARLAGMGQPVTITHLDGSHQTGVVAGVNENGALLLQQNDGSTVTVWAGDVTLRRSE